MARDSAQGIGKAGSCMKRFLYAAPFFISCGIGFNILSSSAFLPLLEGPAQAHHIRHGNFDFSIPRFPYVPSAVDDFIRLITIGFAPAIYDLDPLGRVQLFSFLIDAGVIFAILAIESARPSNKHTLASFPLLLGVLAQALGFGAISGPFLAIYWICAPPEQLAARDMRLTDRRFTTTILPVFLLTFYLPLMVSFFGWTAEQRYFANWIWQPFPIIVSVLQYLLAFIGIAPDTVETYRVQRPRTDLPAIKITLGTLISVSALTWLGWVLPSRFSPAELFVPSATPASADGLVDTMRAFMQWDELLGFFNVYLWIAYGYWDLKSASLVRESTVALVAMAALSTVLLGPGATVGLFWGYREYVISYKRDDDAR